MEPLRMSEHEGLQEFVNALDSRYELPGRTTLSTKLLPELYLKMRIQLLDILKDIDHLAITADSWTSTSNQDILAVTGHFIINRRLTSVLLAAKVMEGNYDADHTASVIASILDDWKCRHKVLALVTDNASTMIKAAEILKIRHIPCFAHSLNLIIKHTIEECPELNALINKCKTIVAHYNHSKLSSDKLKIIQRELGKKELKLIRHVETRWNSCLEMLRRINEIRNELTLAIAQNPRAPENLTAQEYDLIVEVEKIFEPIESCTVAISGDTYVTLSLVIPLIKGTLLHLANVEKELTSEIGRNILETMRRLICTRLKSYETRTPCIISTFLNPHFKKHGFKTDADAERAISLVQKEYAMHLSSLNKPSSASSSNAGTSRELTPENPNKLNLFSFLDQVVPAANANCTSNAIIDIRQYAEKPVIRSNEYPIEFWTYSTNNLKHLALRYLTIPGSSTPAERIFSKAGQIVTERRNRLSGEHINELLFINQNHKILDQ